MRMAKESKEMKMLKELLKDTVYSKEFNELVFITNSTCESLTHLREWIVDLQNENNMLSRREK